MKKNTFLAKVSTIFALAKDWQRGAITRQDFLRRSDCTTSGESYLLWIQLNSPDASIRSFATLAAKN